MIKKGQRNLAGEQFRNFLLIRFSRKNYWIGRCLTCGVEREISRSSMSVGWKTKCKACRLRQRGAYNSWRGMLERCGNVKHEFYHIYGGRGIKVCERWLKFENFWEDMGERPLGMLIDRIEADGDYKPGNCRWVTSLTSGANKRNNHHVMYLGVRMVLSEANRRLGMSPNYLRSTMDNCGWPDIDVGILPSVKSQGFLRNWLKGSCRIEFCPQ